MGKCIFILGGTRSGKSRLAEETAAILSERVLYLATAAPGDAEMRRRIAAHVKRRPRRWRTLEQQTDIAAALRRDGGSEEVVIVDCLTLLLSNLLGALPNPADFEDAAVAEAAALLALARQSEAAFIIVSSEVGLGLVPDNAAGRHYRDVLGQVNQLAAETADEVYLMVAGQKLRLK